MTETILLIKPCCSLESGPWNLVLGIWSLESGPWNLVLETVSNNLKNLSQGNSWDLDKGSNSLLTGNPPITSLIC